MTNRTVMIVEDQMILAASLARRVAATGATVVGPFLTAETALDSIASETPSAAILDINLGGNTTTEIVAESLTELHVPYVFLTGYDGTHPLIEKFPPVLYASKPVIKEDIDAIMAAILPQDGKPLG